MKIFIPTAFFILISCAIYAQTDGISYQAVIIDPNPKEIPGVDLEGNILPNATVSIRFTILDQNNDPEYQEVQTTETDAYGMINVMIGQGEPTGIGLGDFTLIDWDGTPRSLSVEIDFDGSASNFVDLNRQELTFVPYAYHRNITASGDMTVDGTTDLNGVLTVQGPTDLNNSLDVTNGNPTVLSGSLRVDSAAQLNSRLSVEGITNLNDSVNVNNQRPTYFTGDITVDGLATFNGPAEFNSPVNFKEITVDGPSNLNGQVTVRANMDTVGGQGTYEAYPLLVEGSKQGIAIKVNENRSINNNYVSFWDNNQMWGRIEGQTIGNLESDEEYKLEEAFKITDVAIGAVDEGIAIAELAQAGVELAASSSSSTACAGLGACVTAPIPSLIVAAGTNLALKIANLAATTANLVKVSIDLDKFYQFKEDQIGVTYQSGAGDYAEWLPKRDPSEQFFPGDIIGLKDGVISKSTTNADKIMIISTRPMALGNMPPEEEMGDYEKVAFLGQVPAKVVGPVQPGDYILPSEVGEGFAKAVHPDEMNISDYKLVAGVVWGVKSKLADNISLVNVAVGINTNDLSNVIQKQNEELLSLRTEYDALKSQLNASNAALAKLVPGFAEAINYESQSSDIKAATSQTAEIHEEDFVDQSEEDVLYFSITREQVEDALSIAKEQYKEMLNDHQMKELLLSDYKTPAKLDKDNNSSSNLRTATAKHSEYSVENMIFMSMDEHPFWKKLDSDPEYKEEIIQLMMSKFDKAVHTHKKYAHKFTGLELTH